MTGQRHDKAMTAVALQKMPSCKLITPQEIALLDESSIQEDDDVWLEEKAKQSPQISRMTNISLQAEITANRTSVWTRRDQSW